MHYTRRFVRAALWIGYILLFLLMVFAVRTVVLALTQDPEGGTGRTFGVVYYNLTDSYSTAFNETLRSQIEQQGDRLFVRDAARDLQRAADAVDELTRRRVQGIFISSDCREPVADALRRARARGIRVISLDAPPEDPETADLTVIPDHEALGSMCARDLSTRRPEARVLLIEHSGSPGSALRADGFTDWLTTHSDCVIQAVLSCAHSTEAARDQVDAMIRNNIPFDAVFATNGSCALGAMSALTDHKRLSDVLVYCVDASSDTRLLVQEGLMTAAAAPFPDAVSETAVQRMYDLCAGTRCRALYTLPGSLLRQDNIDFFQATDWQ